MSPDKDLVIGWIAPAMCSTRFADSLTRAALDPRLQLRLVSITNLIAGPLIADARCVTVDRFLTTDAQWLLMIDSDMVFTPADILTLLEAADATHRPIVGGLCVGTGQAHSQGIAAEAGWFVDGTIRRVSPATTGGLAQVDFVGAGALLVHRRVYEHLATLHPRPQPWFQEVVFDGRVDGEDWTFCRRATSAGFPIYVHADVRMGHVKSFVITPAAKE